MITTSAENNEDLLQVYTAAEEQKLKEAPAILVQMEPVHFSLKVNFPNYFSKPI